MDKKSPGLLGKTGLFATGSSSSGERCRRFLDEAGRREFRNDFRCLEALLLSESLEEHCATDGFYRSLAQPGQQESRLLPFDIR